MPQSEKDLQETLDAVVAQYQEFMAQPCPQGDAHKFAIGLQFVGAINFCNNLIAKERGMAAPSTLSKTLGPSAPNLRG